MLTAGIFLIDKPVGPTSHDVIARLRRVLGEKTIGHAGTLDPLASGLLIVAVGREFTKQLDRFKKLDKVYEAEVTLGFSSSTDDGEGELTSVSDRQPTNAEVESVTKLFVGKQLQRPPIFSAKKIKGEAAYNLARQNKPVELKPVEVEIKSIDLVDYSYPKMHLRVTVSAGTYIRALARDLGERLGVGAYLSALKRLRIGELSVEQAASLDNLKSADDLALARVV